MSDIQKRFIGMLDGVTESEGRTMALCPAHDDNNPSLAVNVREDGSIWPHCYAGCDTDKILNAMGFKKKDLYPEKYVIKATYDYVDENGSLIHQVIREESDNPKKKRFRQRRPDGQGGWIYNLKGMKTRIYRLPEAIEAVETGKMIFITEGEKDADRAAAVGLVATTSPMGADSWKEHFNPYFEGAEVVLIPDNDAPGHRHMKKVAEQLHGIANIKIIYLPGLQEGEDLSDWMDKGNTADDLLNIVNSTDYWSPEKSKPDICRADLANCTDMGNAIRLASLYGDDLKYCYQSKKWLIWTGTHWTWDDKGLIFQKAKDTVRSIYEEAAGADDKDERRNLATWAMDSESAKSIRAMIKLAESELPITMRELDRNQWLLNVKNGTLDLKTGELKNHNRNDFITKMAPVIYNPNAKSDIFDSFLERILPSKELREFVQRAAGYSITGDTSEEKLFFAFGPAATGKSTLLSAISAVLGDYAATADFESFLSSKGGFGGGPRNDIARLAGRRFVQSVEVDEGKKLAESLIKQITGGDTISARFLHQEYFEFVPSFKLWMAANFQPRVNADDAAMWRRILQIPFDQHIPEEERDPSIKLHLRDVE